MAAVKASARRARDVIAYLSRDGIRPGAVTPPRRADTGIDFSRILNPRPASGRRSTEREAEPLQTAHRDQ